MDHNGSRTIPIYVVDAFTNLPFAGNPAAVCILPQDLSLPDTLLQDIAKEENLSETAYLTGGDPATDSEFQLRWFTPTNEVNLCGHATLATAAVLIKCLKNPSIRFIFRTLSGDLTAELQAGGVIALGLPLSSTDAVPEGIDTNAILKAMTIERSDVYNIAHSPSTKKLVVQLTSNWTRVKLESMPAPEPKALQVAHDGTLIKGVILTVEDFTKEYDFLSRYFAPWNGIPEDPVTGSAHTVLGPYWSSLLDKDHLYARQCSPRGGDVTIQIQKSTNQVTVGGETCIVQQGRLVLPNYLLT